MDTLHAEQQSATRARSVVGAPAHSLALDNVEVLEPNRLRGRSYLGTSTTSPRHSAHRRAVTPTGSSKSHNGRFSSSVPEGDLMTELPRLERAGTHTRLIVDGSPFFCLGGELRNSSASDPVHMAPIWHAIGRSGVNSIIAPVGWDQVEPSEGEFDFSVVDELLSVRARRASASSSSGSVRTRTPCPPMHRRGFARTPPGSSEPTGDRPPCGLRSLTRDPCLAPRCRCSPGLCEKRTRQPMER